MLDSERFDFPRIFGVIRATEGLKRNQTRPLRTEIIELALQKYSGGQLRYVGDKINGVDFLCTDEQSYELKCMDGLFQREVPYTKPITLKNHYGNSSELAQTFDHLIMIDTKHNSIGVCDWNAATRNIKYKDSSVEVRVDHNDIRFLAKNVQPVQLAVDFSQRLNEMIQECI
ncbi:MAG: hypothetical protein ACO3QV_07265 [Candidatus Nanopelagicaceae bacterium]